MNKALIFGHKSPDTDSICSSIVKERLNKNKYLVIYSFLEGLQLGKIYKKLPNDVIKNVAIKLKEFHQLTFNSNIYNLKDIPIKNKQNIKRYSALHFDFTKMNLFLNNEKM